MVLGNVFLPVQFAEVRGVLRTKPISVSWPPVLAKPAVGDDRKLLVIINSINRS